MRGNSHIIPNVMIKIVFILTSCVIYILPSFSLCSITKGAIHQRQHIDTPAALITCQLKDIDESSLCTNQTLSDFVTENFTYPDIAFSRKIEGLTAIQFVIEKNGCISSIKPIRSVDNEIFLELKRILLKFNSKPRWSPAQWKRKDIRSMYTFTHSAGITSQTKVQVKPSRMIKLTVKIENIKHSTIHNRDCTRLQGAINVNIWSKSKRNGYDIADSGDPLPLLDLEGELYKDFVFRNIENEVTSRLEFNVPENDLAQNKVMVNLSSSILGCHKSGDFSSDYNCKLTYYKESIEHGIYINNWPRLHGLAWKSKVTFVADGKHRITADVIISMSHRPR